MSATSMRPTNLRRLIETEGGFTVSLVDGEQVGRGISVCSRPSQSLAFRMCDWDDRTVHEWLAERHREPSRRSRYIGGWIDPRSDTVWFDVVRVVSPRMGPVACLIGRFLQQRCVFDLGRRQTVSLEGSPL